MAMGLGEVSILAAKVKPFWVLCTAVVSWLITSIANPWRVSLASGVASVFSGYVLSDGVIFLIINQWPTMAINTAIQVGAIIATASGPVLVVGLPPLRF